MAPSQSAPPTIDAQALAQALSTLGLMYGAREALAGHAASAADESEAIRNFIRTERAHLLATYDLDALVTLVMDARHRNDSAPASIEQYTPN